MERGNVFHREIGWFDIERTAETESTILSTAIPARAKVFHWHGDTFDLPNNAKRLASTDITENQAFAVGDKALGLQFHLEADPREIEYWLIGHAHEIGATEGISPESIRADTTRYGAAVAASASGCMLNWMETCGLLPAREGN